MAAGEFRDKDESSSRRRRSAIVRLFSSTASGRTIRTTSTACSPNAARWSCAKCSRSTRSRSTASRPRSRPTCHISRLFRAGAPSSSSAASPSRISCRVNSATLSVCARAGQSATNSSTCARWTGRLLVRSLKTARLLLTGRHHAGLCGMQGTHVPFWRCRATPTRSKVLSRQPVRISRCSRKSLSYKRRSSVWKTGAAATIACSTGFKRRNPGDLSGSRGRRRQQDALLSPADPDAHRFRRRFHGSPLLHRHAATPVPRGYVSLPGAACGRASMPAGDLTLPKRGFSTARAGSAHSRAAGGRIAIR